MLDQPREETAGHTAVVDARLDGYGNLRVGTGIGEGDAGDKPMSSVDEASTLAPKRCAVG